MRRSSLFWAVVLILAGSVLLLGNLGLFDRLEINSWNLIWPLLLIALGAWFIFGTLRGPEPVQTVPASIPTEGASRASIKINHGAGRLTLAAGETAGALACGDFAGGVKYTTRREGDTLHVKMRVPDRSGAFLPWTWTQGGVLDWDVRLNPDLPLALEFETGASQSEIDLSELRVTDLELETGASASTVTLPAKAGLTRVKIEAGAASVNVRVPGGVAARIRSESGLARVSVDETRFPRQGAVYESPDYDAAAHKAEIKIEAGVGAVDVR
jgi:hypothetical protein